MKEEEEEEGGGGRPETQPVTTITLNQLVFAAISGQRWCHFSSPRLLEMVQLHLVLLLETFPPFQEMFCTRIL